MYNCELYCVLSNEQDVEAFNKKLDTIADSLYKKDIRVMFNTEIENNEKAFTKALKEADESIDSPDYFIFVNALDTEDPSSFKTLFHSFVRDTEKLITPEEEQESKIAKIKISSLGDLGNGYPGYCFNIYDKHYIVLPQASLTENEISFLINKAVDRAEEIFEKNRVEIPNGIAYIDAPVKQKKKEGFISSFIPKKADSKSTKIRKWISIFAIIIFLVAAGYLVNRFVIQPYLNAQLTSEIYDIAYDDDSAVDGEDDDGPKQNWDKLKKVNKEIVGWITLNKTKIDYPVLEHKGDNAYSQYYLNHTYKKTYSQHGSVFVDYRCTDSVDSKNVILHGHNMPDGSMFKALMGYGDLTGNLDYYKKHPIIEFNTPDGDAQYKIISVFKTSTYYAHGEFFNYMQASFLSDAEFMNFVYNCRIRSLIDCPVMVNEDDTLLTLSTCSYEYSGFRTVVVARKVREGEKAKVDTDLATLNDNPLFPEVYYTSRGGERPKVLTFKTANQKGQVDWYDGSGNLEGSEVLTATVEANPTEPPTEKKKKKSSSAEMVNYYEVKFVNWDGTEYYTVSVREGDSVSPPSGTPGLPSDEYYNYKFTGWDTGGLDLDSVHYSMTIYPKFKATLK